MAELITFLMFQGDARPALDLYLDAFGDDAVTHELQLRDDGTVEQAIIELGGQRLRIFDSPPVHDFTFTPSISLFVTCQSEDEQQRLHDVLGEGGGAMMPLGDYGFSQRFAWISDRFGVSWQLDLP
jgi:predicted 3-demethylubiquinone-9 3-methyltransferase (glyoxalase superfamily)